MTLAESNWITYKSLWPISIVMGVVYDATSTTVVVN